LKLSRLTELGGWAKAQKTHFADAERLIKFINRK